MDASKDEGATRRPDWFRSVDMLRAVVEGQTYRSVGATQGVSRTAVERRIKRVAAQLACSVGLEGLNMDGAASVQRLRQHRHAVLQALAQPLAATPSRARNTQILSQAQIASGAQRIRARSAHPLEDLALYYLLFATAARPLEIARLEVCDYLQPDGKARLCSEVRSEVAITGRARPLYFGSAVLCAALDAYLADRVRRQRGVGACANFRGLDPHSRLFLSATGLGFEITPYGDAGQHRYQCRAIWEHYRKLFHHAGQKQLNALTARHTVADRLYARGADETQIGVLFGIADRSAVREQFPRPVPDLDVLTRDLV